MEQKYSGDRERSVGRGTGWEKFKSYLGQQYPDLNVDALLKKVPLKRDAVISYGLIEFVVKNDRVYYHVYRRRNTMEYDILIRGFAQSNQLFDLICLLSEDERERILTHEWQDLWDDYWTDHNDGAYARLQAQSKRRFYEIKEVLQLIKNDVQFKIGERPFIFPKGRPNKGETGLDAALREAREETKTHFDTGELYFNSPIIQNYTGSDDRQYTDYYYVWERDQLYACPVHRLSTIRYIREDSDSDSSDSDETKANSRNNPVVLKLLPNTYTIVSGLQEGTMTESIITREEIKRIRTKTISHELESDAWIEIPIFKSVRDLKEWENSIDPFEEFGLFKRHFNAIMKIHSHLS